MANDYSEEYPLSSTNNYCLDFAAADRYEKADKELNIIYQKIINKFSHNQQSNDDYIDYNELKPLFIKAQRQWILFCDTECNAWYQLNARGSGRNQTTMQCYEERTIDRIKQLNQWLDQL